MSEAAGRPAPQEFEKVLTGAAATVASFDEDRFSVLQRTQRFLHSYPTVVPFVVLLLGVLLGVVVNPSRFTAASNISTILTQVMVIGIVGVGQTLVILTAGIDLSIGVIMVISSVVMGRLAVYGGVPTFIAFPIGILVGAAFGYLNGALITRLKMPPFIVTLGTLSIIGALAKPSACRTSRRRHGSCKSWAIRSQLAALESCGARSSCSLSRPSSGTF
jgi:fructose transport system permease protein